MAVLDYSMAALGRVLMGCMPLYQRRQHGRRQPPLITKADVAKFPYLHTLMLVPLMAGFWSNPFDSRCYLGRRRGARVCSAFLPASSSTSLWRKFDLRLGRGSRPRPP